MNGFTIIYRYDTVYVLERVQLVAYDSSLEYPKMRERVKESL